MKSRNTSKSIDASSIADIAFLLLAFIIISTTLEKEKGVPAVLPQKSTYPSPPSPIQKRNILQILINKNNEIQIEEEYKKSLLDVQISAKEFMSNPLFDKKLPVMDKITPSLCKSKINFYKEQEYSSEKLVKWRERLNATKLLGEFYTVNKTAIISIKYDKATSYGSYLEIRDYILRGLNELRNELCQEKFGISYSKLESMRTEVKTNEQIAIQKAVRQVYPQRIIKLEAIEK